MLITSPSFKISSLELCVRFKLPLTSSKVFLFGFINIGSELNKYKYVERVKLLPRWDKPEPKLVLPKIDYFNERVYKRILNSFKFQNKKFGKNYIIHLLKM